MLVCGCDCIHHAHGHGHAPVSSHVWRSNMHSLNAASPHNPDPIQQGAVAQGRYGLTAGHARVHTSHRHAAARPPMRRCPVRPPDISPPSLLSHPRATEERGQACAARRTIPKSTDAAADHVWVRVCVGAGCPQPGCMLAERTERSGGHPPHRGAAEERCICMHRVASTCACLPPLTVLCQRATLTQQTPLLPLSSSRRHRSRRRTKPKSPSSSATPWCVLRS